MHMCERHSEIHEATDTLFSRFPSGSYMDEAAGSSSSSSKFGHPTYFVGHIQDFIASVIVFLKAFSNTPPKHLGCNDHADV